MRERFKERFGPFFEDESPRFEAFQFLVTFLSCFRIPPIIMEIVPAHARCQDGAESTLIWDWFIQENKYRGYAYSLSANEDVTDMARKRVQKAYCVSGDPQDYLRNFAGQDLIDLIFFGAHDWFGSGPANTLSELATIGEFSAIYANLKVGCMIAVDNCVNDEFGCHVLIQEFFKRLGVEPVFSGKITIWRKPKEGLSYGNAN